jgi:hypothetical protein
MSTAHVLSIWVGALVFIALAGLGLTLAIWELMRARFPAIHRKLGNLGSIGGAASWLRFIWSSRPREIGDFAVWRLAISLRALHVLYTPLFFGLVGLFFWAVIAGSGVR